MSKRLEKVAELEVAKPQVPVSDEAIREMQEQRFRIRVERVLAVMRQERVDFRGLPFITPDGRVAARVVPVEMAEQPTS